MPCLDAQRPSSTSENCRSNQSLRTNPRRIVLARGVLNFPRRTAGARICSGVALSDLNSPFTLQSHPAFTGCGYFSTLHSTHGQSCPHPSLSLHSLPGSARGALKTASRARTASLDSVGLTAGSARPTVRQRGRTMHRLGLAESCADGPLPSLNAARQPSLRPLLRLAPPRLGQPWSEPISKATGQRGGGERGSNLQPALPPACSDGTAHGMETWAPSSPNQCGGRRSPSSCSAPLPAPGAAVLPPQGSGSNSCPSERLGVFV